MPEHVLPICPVYTHPNPLPSRERGQDSTLLPWIPDYSGMTEGGGLKAGGLAEPGEVQFLHLEEGVHNLFRVSLH